MELTIHYRGQGTLLAYSGAMMFAILDHEAGHASQIEHAIALMDMLLERHEAIALLVVLEHGARKPDAEERRRMQETLDRYGERLIVGYATCGLGFWASAVQAVLVGVSRMVGAPIIMHGTVEATAEHLARELVGLNAGRMSALVEQARAQLRDGCRPG